MYYVNMEQVEERLQFLPAVAAGCRAVAEKWNGKDPIVTLAQERALHLAIESVTDIGSLLIDGFMMRDASSYEDIVEVLAGEGVFPAALVHPLQELVRLRRPLVQDYIRYERSALHPLTGSLPGILEEFAGSVRAFVEKELKLE